MPLPVISIAQMREWESATWASGQSEAEVIQQVGRAVAWRALQLTRPGDLILILAGKGHNGDDARCAIEQLAERRAELLDVKNPEAELSRLDEQLSRRPALIVDGLFGIGINRRLDEAWVKFIEHVNTARAQVLAVDVPSGLNGDDGEAQGAAIEASVTLTVGAPKTGLLKAAAWPHVGRLEVAAEVGLSPCPHQTELNWTLAGDFAGVPPRRPASGHKGTFGHLAILGGSAGFHGAAVLAARGAQRARPGLITLLVHEPAYIPAASQLQSAMVQSWSPGIRLPGDFSALLVGPGLASPAVPDEMRTLARRLWLQAAIPVIVDASALPWLPRGGVTDKTIRVITPHPGEAARLLDTTAAQVQANRPQAVRELSRRFGDCWVVLKGHLTLVGRSSGDLFVNSSGNPGLAQGGAGDILSGYLAGLLAQPALQAEASQALRYAVWQHGAAADRLERTKPNWVIEDLAGVLGGIASA